MAKRIGIPRALHAYHHFAFWRALFTELGWEVVLSEPTTRPVIDVGVRIAPAEICLPVKAFLGHVAELSSRVDAMLLSRHVCTRIADDWFFGCPKTIALPDLTRAVFQSLPAVVEPVLDEQKQTEEQAFCAALAGLSPARAVREALRSANVAGAAAAERTRGEHSPVHMFAEQGGDVIEAHCGQTLRVGVVGHPYLLFDAGMSLDVLNKVKQAGAQPLVVFPNRDEVEAEARLDTRLNWYYELELLAAARRLLEKEGVDGLLLVASFACGTGAVTNELIQRKAVHDHGVPTLLVLLDEHTGEAGLVTRIESFVDLLRPRRR